MRFDVWKSTNKKKEEKMFEDTKDPYVFQQLKDGRYQLVTRIHPATPDDYKQCELKEHRLRVGIGLAEILQVKKMPAVIDYEEKITEADPDPYGYGMAYGDYGYSQIRTIITVSPVQHRHITMPTFSPVEYGLYQQRKLSRWERFKSIFEK